MADPVAVGKAFTDHYYQTFDTNRSALASLYQDASMLTFEGQQFQGTQAIVEKLTGLPFQSVQHRVVSLDAQPTHAGGLLVFVTGQLLTDGESKPLNFSQVFSLMNAGGSYVRVVGGLMVVVVIYSPLSSLLSPFSFLTYSPTLCAVQIVTNDLFRLNYG